ncbi:MAG: redox-sensing transcriptional repressor Rex [Dehalococcoidia bacterium]|nr:MAG: redox-sensing transcriptional repressor Rex [Dehalococcoidia bacterium]
MSARIPDVVIRRLPIYARALAHLQEEGISVVSSLELGRRLGVTPAQIRKDLSYFGEFGKQGTGYAVGHLLTEIRRILGLDQEWRLAIVGIGRLGRAIASYPGFTREGFRVAALFDNDPAKIGQSVGTLIIHGMDELATVVAAEQVQIGIVAVPAAEGQAVVDQLVACGVTALLNYAPISVSVPPHVQVRDVDPVIALQSMTYYLRHPTAATTNARGRLHLP